MDGPFITTGSARGSLSSFAARYIFIKLHVLIIGSNVFAH